MTDKKVKATALSTGFYGGKRIRKGQTFMVADNARGKWFTVEVAEAEPAKRGRKAAAEKPEVPAEDPKSE